MIASNDCVDEDLEDGEIFDDEDDNFNADEAAPSLNKSKQPSEDASNNSTLGSGINRSSSIKRDSKDKESPVPDSTTSTSGKLISLAVADSTNGSIKNDQSSGSFIPWKSSNANITSASDSSSAKRTNSHNDDEKRSSKDKKKKRKRLKDGDEDEKHSKEKRLKKSSDKDALSDMNNHMDHLGDNLQLPDDEGLNDDDDDEMLFIRGASPTMNHYNNKRHHRSSRDEDDDHLLDDDDNDFMGDEDDDFDDEDDNDNEDMKRLRLNDPSGRLDRAARRERLSARGKRRGRGGTNSREGSNKRRKDDGEICIFYLQGKCHKGGECSFSHDAMPHKKMELCKFYLMDCCNKKDKCLYMHGEFPCKYYHMGLKCYANKSCKFSHAKLTDVMRQVFIKTFGPINRPNKEFSNKKGSSNKHRQQDGPGDFPRGRDGRRGSENNKRAGPAGGNSNIGGGNGPGGPEKKIPSLFDIKVSIPTEMRNNANSNNNHSDSDGNHTPMPSPPHMQHMSDSSRSPPPLSMSPTMQSGRKRRKERKSDRMKKNSDRHRDDRNESGNKRLPLMMMNNDTNWDEMMLEHQRLQQQFLAESCGGNFEDDSDHNDNDNEQCHISNNQFFSSHQDNFSSNSNLSNSNISVGKSHNVDDGGTSDGMSFPQRSPSPQNDSDSGGLQIASQSNEMFPAHLPKKQRELFLRIKQQQRQAEDSGNNGGGRLQVVEDGDDIEGNDSSNAISERTDSFVPSNCDNKDKMNDDYNSKLKQHDENWYSSDEDDELQQSVGTTSLSAILQNLVRMNSSSGNLSPSSQLNVNSTFSNIQSPVSAVTSSVVGNSSVNNINPAGISNVDIDVNEVSELLSKVKQHFQSSTSEKKVRDPRLSRSDVGPSGDNQNGGSNAMSSTIPNNFPTTHSINQSHVPSAMGNDDVDLRLNASNNRGVGAGDMDLRNLPFKPAPVHSAATEIDASINSHSPLPYKLIPVAVAKPDYSSIQPNSKVGSADPRLRKTLRLSEESSSVVSSRDPRHRLVDNKDKPSVPPVQNSDPRQRARANVTAMATMNPTAMADESQLPPSLMLPPHLRSPFPMMQTPGPDMGMMCPPTPRLEDEPPNYMATMPSRPTDPRQRHSQVNLPNGPQLPPSLFDAINALQNVRQPNFLSQTGDPRSRPNMPGMPNMPNMVFPGAVRSNDPINRGQFGFK